MKATKSIFNKAMLASAMLAGGFLCGCKESICGGTECRTRYKFDFKSFGYALRNDGLMTYPLFDLDAMRCATGVVSRVIDRTSFSPSINSYVDFDIDLADSHDTLGDHVRLTVNVDSDGWYDAPCAGDAVYLGYLENPVRIVALRIVAKADDEPWDGYSRYGRK